MAAKGSEVSVGDGWKGEPGRRGRERGGLGGGR